MGQALAFLPLAHAPSFGSLLVAPRQLFALDYCRCASGGCGLSRDRENIYRPVDGRCGLLDIAAAGGTLQLRLHPRLERGDNIGCRRRRLREAVRLCDGIRGTAEEQFQRR
eukprot:COSAG06_NODE_1641_length_8829_cov_23.966667_2_plen_111_part_00